MSTIIEGPISLLPSSFVQCSLIAVSLVDLSDPVMGIYLVHRHLAMLGDGTGHASLTGVALGWFVGTFVNATPQDSWALSGAMIVSVLGTITIELARQSGHTSADVAFVMLFYGGTVGGVLLVGLVGDTSVQFNSYLFGSIATVIRDDILIISTLSVLISLVGADIVPALFSVTSDEDFARSVGLPARELSMVIVISSALTVAIAMCVVGSLLVSALMVIPAAIAQFSARSFMTAMARFMVHGALICTTGLSFTYFVDPLPGASIVVLAIGIYALGSAVRTIIDAKQQVTRVRQVRAPAEYPELAYHNEPAEWI